MDDNLQFSILPIKVTKKRRSECAVEEPHLKITIYNSYEMIHKLSPELVSYIGKFMDRPTRRICLETSHLFAPICWTVTEHVMYVTNNTCRAKMENLSAALRYITRVKPVLTYFVLKFHNVSTFDDDTNMIIDTNIVPCDRILIMINNCQSANRIIQQTPSNIRISIIDEYVIPFVNVLLLADKRVVFINIGNSVMNDIFETGAISNVRKIRFDQYDHSCVDLRPVDITRNVELVVRVTRADFPCIYPSRLTELIDCSMNNVLQRKMFIGSLALEEDYRAKSRMKQVWIHHSIHVDSAWIQLCRLLPADVMYNVCPQDPDVFSFIDVLRENGVKNIQYFYYSRETYIRCLLARAISIHTKSSCRKYDLPITEAASPAGLGGVEMPTYETIRDIYGALSNDGKYKWKCVDMMMGVD